MVEASLVLEFSLALKDPKHINSTFLKKLVREYHPVPKQWI